MGLNHSWFVSKFLSWVTFTCSFGRTLPWDLYCNPCVHSFFYFVIQYSDWKIKSEKLPIGWLIGIRRKLLADQPQAISVSQTYFGFRLLKCFAICDAHIACSWLIVIFSYLIYTYICIVCIYNMYSWSHILNADHIQYNCTMTFVLFLHIDFHGTEKLFIMLTRSIW